MIETLPGGEEIILTMLKPEKHCCNCMALLSEKGNNLFCPRCGAVYLY